MTIGKETHYFGGLIHGAWEDLPSGTVLPINDKGFAKEMRVVDPNTVRFKLCVEDNVLERTLVGEEINSSGFRIGPSNFREMILGKSTYIYWDPDIPGGEDMEHAPQFPLRLQSAGI